jgi:hypothetical protein
MGLVRRAGRNPPSKVGTPRSTCHGGLRWHQTLIVLLMGKELVVGFHFSEIE